MVLILGTNSDRSILTEMIWKDVHVVSLDERFNGVVIDVDRELALVVRLGDGSIRRVFSADVSMQHSIS